MIVARIFGGLGNQLFIYYSALSLAKQNKTILKIDNKSGYTKDKYNRIFLLDKFLSFNENDYANKKESYTNIFGRFERSCDKIFSKIKLTNKNIYYKDNNKFNKKFLKLSAPIYLDAYLQYFVYFNEIKDTIHRDYNDFFLKNIKKIKHEVNIENDVAICFRSFSEIKNPKSINIEYYKKCIKNFLKKNLNSKFIIFTDSKKYVEENFSFISNYNIQFDQDREDPLLNFLHLSRYRKIIISNSTFHWWAAFIHCEKKTIYAPRKNEYQFYYPPNWNLL